MLCRAPPLLGLLLAWTAPCFGDVVVFSDDFSGAGGPLNGTTPDNTTLGEVWEAGDTFLDDGTAGTTVAGSADGQAAHLDFTPLGDRVYTAQATVLNDQPNWIGFGFLCDDPQSGDWTQTAWFVRHSNAPGYGWMLTRNSTGNDQEGFLGGGTAGGQPWNGDVADPTAPIDMKIVLDTTAANWTVEWFINDVSHIDTETRFLADKGLPRSSVEIVDELDWQPSLGIDGGGGAVCFGRKQSTEHRDIQQCDG